jgi:hypothetical protein
VEYPEFKKSTNAYSLHISIPKRTQKTENTEKSDENPEKRPHFFNSERIFLMDTC